MNNIFFRCMLGIALVISITRAQKIATISVSVDAPSGGIPHVFCTDLDRITFLPEDELTLFLINGQERIVTPHQVSGTTSRTLNWAADSMQSGEYTYELHQGHDQNTKNPLSYRKESGRLIFAGEGHDLLAYQYETFFPPDGVDPAFSRSGFIHPLWSPNGQILTRIQPADHYHHYGIWNPWTHVLFEKDTVDFWNLLKKQGTVRHDKFLAIELGSVFGEFKALHEHVAFQKDGTQKIALNELQTLRIFRQQGDRYIIDFTVNLNCAGESPVNLLEYRYGGFGWRATEQWHKDNSEMFSSAGKSRKDIDNTLAEWFYVQGEVDDQYAGILMMSNPANFNHPQPVRMWGIPEEGRGDVFASFSPTRNTDWPLHPGKTYSLRYRFVVYNGHMDTSDAEKFWENYIKTAEIKVKVEQ